MVDRKPSRKTLAESTILGSVEPMSDEAGEVLDAERRKSWCVWALDWILFEAISDKVLAATVCEAVGNFARDDADLVAALKKFSSRSSRGRPSKWNREMYRQLLIHYAHAVLEADGNVDCAITKLIEYDNRLFGSLLSPKAMNNNISDAIRVLTDADLLESLFKEIDWVRKPIQARIDSGFPRKKIG